MKLPGAGKGGETRRRLETETGTKVAVPRRGQEGAVVVEGRSHRGVSAAANRCRLTHGEPLATSRQSRIVL